MTRTFIALEMDEDLQRHLSGVIRQVAQALPTIRWVNPTGIHLTLAFLGELDDEQLVEAEQATEAIAQQNRPFSYSLSRLGVFGSQRSPRVIWMGIDEPTGALNLTHRALQGELVKRGFEVDTRPFSPHLTLARVKSPLKADEQQHLQRLLTKEQEARFTSKLYIAHSLHVVKSELLKTGAHYTVLREYPFYL
jgi:2'-5' RNA ligase